MSSKLIFIIAFFAIAVGLYGLSEQLLQSEPETIIESTAPTPENRIRIWTTKKSLAVGESITHSTLSTTMIPESEANELGIVDDVMINYVPGAVSRLALEKGELVTPDMIATPDQDGYVDFIIEKNRVPYAIEVENTSVVGGVITHGTRIDILALVTSELSSEVETTVASNKNVSLTPILMDIKVLQVKIADSEEVQDEFVLQNVSLILELTRKQVATLTIAKRIAELEVHKSAGIDSAKDLSANAGDVLPEFKAIKEYRAGEVSVK